MSISRFFKLAGAASALIMLSACATTNEVDVATDTGSSSGVDTRPTGPVPGSMEDLVQNVGNMVYFGYDEYTLTGEAQATLARQAAWMKEYPTTRILLAGNCDERGTREYNLALGARRAQAARAYLVSLGVDGSRIQTVSYGKEKPVDPRSNEQAWSKNRNATTSLMAASS